MIGSSFQVWSYTRFARSTVAIAAPEGLQPRRGTTPKGHNPGLIVESACASCDRPAGLRLTGRVRHCPRGRPVYNRRGTCWRDGEPMETNVDQRIGELTRRMLRKKLYVVFSTANAAPERIRQVLPLHLEYMIDLEK